MSKSTFHISFHADEIHVLDIGTRFAEPGIIDCRL